MDCLDGYSRNTKVRSHGYNTAEHTSSIYSVIVYRTSNVNYVIAFQHERDDSDPATTARINVISEPQHGRPGVQNGSTELSLSATINFDIYSRRTNRRQTTAICSMRTSGFVADFETCAQNAAAKGCRPDMASVALTRTKRHKAIHTTVT
jgi:hypothetical protein